MPASADQILSRVLQEEKRAAIRAHYLAAAKGNAGKADAMVRSDAFIGAPTYMLADKVSRVQPVWLYRFDTQPTQTRAVTAGAPHGTELFYVFGTLDRFPFHPEGASDADRATSAALVDYWTSFARDGVPTSRIAPSWPGFSSDTRSRLNVDGDGIVVAPALGADIMPILATPLG